MWKRIVLSFLVLALCAGSAWAGCGSCGVSYGGCGGGYDSGGYGDCGVSYYGGCSCSPCGCGPSYVTVTSGCSTCGVRECPLPPDTSYKAAVPTPAQKTAPVAPAPAPKSAPKSTYPIPEVPRIEGPSVPGALQPPSATTGQFMLKVPSDAQVWINGKATTSTGTQRTYISHNLNPDYTYEYAIVVSTGGQIYRGRVTLAGGDVRAYHLNAQEPASRAQYVANPEASDGLATRRALPGELRFQEDLS